MAKTLIGLLIAAGLLGLGVAAMLVLIWADQGRPVFAALDSSRLIFSLKSAGIQALLSVLFSLVLAIPAAIALARRRSWFGIKSLVMVISLAMVMPTTVAANGLLSVWGRSGIVADICAMLFASCGEISIYGLHGVVAGHMMLNLPLMVRVFMPLLQGVSSAQWRLAALLGLSSWQRFRHVEFPALSAAIPGVSALVFLLCFTSFALVLMLGGGPKVTTLEVEIYSALRFDFDLTAAAGLSLIQFACAAVVVAILAAMGSIPAVNQVEVKHHFISRKDLKNIDKLLDFLVIAMIFGLIVLPVVMVAVDGLNLGMLAVLKRRQFYSALALSASIASISALTVTVLAFLMAEARVNLVLANRMIGAWPFKGFGVKGAKILLDSGVMLYLVIPSVVLGTASFIALRSYGDVLAHAFWVVVVANILLALPFAVRLLECRLVTIARRHDRLAASLGIAGLARMKALTLPLLSRDLGVIMGLTAALSIGDLGVIALFAHAEFKTLPWMLYQLGGQYRTGEAASLALVLLLLTAAMFGLGRGVIWLMVEVFWSPRNA
jgi:thiamine transport system permease protein